MSRKDYVAIARAIAAERRHIVDPVHRDAIDHMIHAIANVLQNDNPRFNRTRFLDACKEED